MTTRRFRRLCRQLRQHAPCNLPVHVRRVRGWGRGRWGDCARVAGAYRIRINAGMSPGTQDIALLHEWAHAQTWDLPGDHGAHFAEAFARLLRWYQAEGEWD